MNFSQYYKQIFSIKTRPQFSRLAELAFNHQVEKVDVYSSFVNRLKGEDFVYKDLNTVPFLPVDFFKQHSIVDSSVATSAGLCFKSSGTTGSERSVHFVSVPALYERSFLTGFEREYGSPQRFSILALLPSYMERPDASLLYMVSELIRLSSSPQSGFYPQADAPFIQALEEAMSSELPVLIIGVTFALLDWAERNPMPLRNVIMMETGGMKGRRAELVRPELHDILKRSFNLPGIHSEYGMTELLSQAYSRKNGKFHPPPWMHIAITDPFDPFRTLPEGQLGQIRVIDLANIHSCCFIQTHDLGRCFSDGSFTVEGRLDNSEIRGCNLLMSM
jgi:hypothetical protein